MLLSLNYPALRLLLDGMLLMMLVYTLISYAWHRKQIHSLYSLYIMIMLGYLYLNDLCHFYEDAQAPAARLNLAMLTESVLQCISFIIYGRFAILLMNLPDSDPLSVRLINAIAVLSLSLIVVDIICFLTGVTNHPVQQLFHITSRYALAACALATVPRILRLHNRVVSFFITGTLLYVLGALLGLVMFQLGWATRQISLPFTFPMVLMEIGIVLETICITIGISLQNRQTEQDKIRIQAQLIEQLHENQLKQNQLNNLRDEIARDLHDEMGSQLSSISIMSQTMARYVTDSRAQQRLTTIGQTARDVMESMREIVWSLNSSSNTLQNIGLRIHETAQRLLSDCKAELYVHLPETNDLHGLTQQQRRELHLIAKECLTNILRHASAKRIGIRLQRRQDTLVVMISDDGVGFDPASQASGLGLTSIRQRAERMNAQLRIESEPGEGTAITLVCPFSTKMPLQPLSLKTSSQQESFFNRQHEHIHD